MSGPILIYLPDDLLAEVNKRVEAAKASDMSSRKLTKAERDKANAIGKSKGRTAAERYIRTLNRSQDKRRSSRVKVIRDLIQVGLKHTKH